MIKEKENLLFQKRIFVWVPFNGLGEKMFSQYDSLRDFLVRDVISVLSNDLIYKTC